MTNRPNTPEAQDHEQAEAVVGLANALERALRLLDDLKARAYFDAFQGIVIRDDRGELWRRLQEWK
jgi:hypothetical protein